MGFCEERHGRVSIERRSESFKIHAGYGYDDGERVYGAFAERWRDQPHPEFKNEDIDDLIAALTEARDKMRGITPVKPEVFGSIDHILHSSEYAYHAFMDAFEALNENVTDARAFLHEKNTKRNGSLSIEFRVNGFPMNFTAFCERVGAYVAGLDATFDARVEKAAGEMLLKRANDLQERIEKAAESIGRAIRHDVYALFPTAQDEEEAP